VPVTRRVTVPIGRGASGRLESGRAGRGAAAARMARSGRTAVPLRPAWPGQGAPRYRCGPHGPVRAHRCGPA